MPGVSPISFHGLCAILQAERQASPDVGIKFIVPVPAGSGEFRVPVPDPTENNMICLKRIELVTTFLLPSDGVDQDLLLKKNMKK